MAKENIGGLDVFITQAGKAIAPSKLKNNHIRITLSKKPFDFHYSAKEIGMCVSLNPVVFDMAKTGTNTTTNFASCMFMYKAFGLSGEGGDLVVDKGGVNWLNKTHGAKKGKDGRNFYRVENLTGKETGDLTLTKAIKPMYLAIWVDKDSNKIIDKGELARLELTFK